MTAFRSQCHEELESDSEINPIRVTKARPTICLVAHNAYGVLAGVDTGHMGGIEVQTPLTAKWFAAKGFPTSMITWDEGESHGHVEGQVLDGVKAHKMCRRDDGVPVLRFVHPRWTSLHAALDRADPDIVYYNCGDLGLGQVVLWVWRRARKVLYSVASDVDCMRSLPVLKPKRERILYRYGLSRVNRIVVQTHRQKELLRDEFGLDSRVIPMPSRGFVGEGGASRKAPEGALRVLWVGRLAEEKRLEWLLDLAEWHPGMTFDVLGAANTGTAYARKLIERVERIPNVTLHGRVSHDAMGRFYREAHLLLSTSVFEGFPNVFLEAWSVGIPLVTTFDPDGVVAKSGHGAVALDVPGLAKALMALAQPERWQQASAAAVRYFEKYHQVDNCMQMFEEEILRLAP